MKNLGHYIKTLGLIILFSIILLIHRQQEFPIYQETALKGYYISATDSQFTWSRWLSGDYQKYKEQFLNEHLGYRNTMIRWRNQFDFSIFKQLNIQDAFVGDSDYIFSLGEMYQINGAYNRWENELEEDVIKLKKAHDYLAAKGIPLIIVLAPGKAYYYKKYVPERWYSHDPKSCYTSFLEYSKKYDFNTVDLNDYYMKLADTITYPLYPKTGIHWSIYGSLIGLDTIMKSVSHYTHKNMPSVHIASMNISDKPDEYDADVLTSCNLIYPIKSGNLAYPTLTIDTSSGRPNLLVIGDSFFNSIYWTGIFPKVSNNKSAYWYYCREGFTKEKNNIEVKKLNFLQELDGRDAVILLYSPPNLFEEVWKFPRMLDEVRNLKK